MLYKVTINFIFSPSQYGSTPIDKHNKQAPEPIIVNLTPRNWIQIEFDNSTYLHLVFVTYGNFFQNFSYCHY